MPALSAPPEALRGPSTVGSSAALRAGERTAWEALVDALEPGALGLARRILNDRDRAAEAVQEAFLRAYRRRDSLRDDSRIPQWLLAIVGNTAREFLRADRSEGQRRQEWGKMRDDVVAPEQAGEPDLALRQALAELDELSRTAFLLIHQAGCSYDEAAAGLGCPPGTVRSRVHRARLALKSALERRSRA